MNPTSHIRFRGDTRLSQEQLRYCSRDEVKAGHYAGRSSALRGVSRIFRRQSKKLPNNQHRARRMAHHFVAGASSASSAIMLTHVTP